MSYPEILRDSENNPIPQIWDEEEQGWKPATNEVKIAQPTVEIGGITFRLVNGDRLVGTEAQRPSAQDAAEAVFPGVFYHAYDTGKVSQSMVSDWRHVGVA